MLIRRNSIFLTRHAQAGASLLEVLVATVIISIGLLGLAGMQATGIKNTYGAFLRAQAAQFAYDMADRMRANRIVARAGNYNLLMSDDAPANSSAIVDADRIEWLADLATLPQGDGSINVTSDAITIVVQWNDSRAAGAATTANITITTSL